MTTNATNVVALEGDRRHEEKFLRELGTTVRAEIEDPNTEDIVLNSDSRLWLKRRGSHFKPIGVMRDFQAMMLIGTIAYMRGNLVVNPQTPILECDLPVFKSRFEAIVPPVVSAPIFAIRGRAHRVRTFGDYEADGIITRKDDPLNYVKKRDTFAEECKGGLSHVEIFEHAILNRKNILIAGSTGSGKTTLCNAFLEAQVRLTPNDRTLLIEDTPELNCMVENSVSLLSSANCSMLDCLKACMRLKPDRISVGEVRGKEALTLLKAWNTGHSGGFATLHADDAKSALLRLEELVAEATEARKQATIARAVDLVVFIDGDPEMPKGRKVKEVCLVTGYRADGEGGGEFLVEYV
jgi:type IV secretion system protein VirB11